MSNNGNHEILEEFLRPGSGVVGPLGVVGPFLDARCVRKSGRETQPDLPPPLGSRAVSFSIRIADHASQLVGSESM